MAKALTRPRGGRKGVPEDERELKRLCLSVCDDTGFRLYAATYDQPKRRDELIRRLSAKARAEKVRVTRLDIAAAAPEASLVALLRAHLQAADLPAGWRGAVMVAAIEQRLDYSSGRAGVAFLHQANLLRDALPGAAPVPVVLWLSPLATSAMQKEAPDLWDWRAASFDFTGDEAPRVELLRELNKFRPEYDLGMSGDQRSARIRMLEDLLAELEREGPPNSKRQAAERATLLLELGIERRRLGSLVEAVSHFEQALQTFREIGDRRREGVTLGNLGIAWSALGEPRRAIEFYEQRLSIAREVGDRWGEARVLGNLGTAWPALGEPRRAVEFYSEQLEIVRQIGDRQGEGNAIGNLGVAYANLGEPRPAVELYEQALAIAREIGDLSGEVSLLGNLGVAFKNMGEPWRALGLYEQQLRIAREIGDRRGEANAIGDLGNTWLVLGEPRRALEFYDEAMRITREIGDRRGEGTVLFDSALALDQLGERSEAIRRMEEALRLYEDVEHPARVRARLTLEDWRPKEGGIGGIAKRCAPHPRGTPRRAAD